MGKSVTVVCDVAFEICYFALCGAVAVVCGFLVSFLDVLVFVCYVLGIRGFSSAAAFVVVDFVLLSRCYALCDFVRDPFCVGSFFVFGAAAGSAYVVFVVIYVSFSKFFDFVCGVLFFCSLMVDLCCLPPFGNFSGLDWPLVLDPMWSIKAAKPVKKALQLIL
ncbi:hypothetical protein [Pseudobutyrivibrio sp. ACV-2]|uniref:hypothetical protein n=1 Tax=Pseudobutyrivibrio sp. ACV-2 TaxID=1520801 RepID=UPI000B7D1667|nr:hypothetical protein [Pseudobutyrivibrio sp. ACV-2]